MHKIELNKGMIVENAAAQMLTATGRSLYFFTRYDKNNADERMDDVRFEDEILYLPLYMTPFL